MPEQKIGSVFKFFAKVSVAAIQVTDGEVAVGDTMHFKGATTDFTQTIESMEIDRQRVERAGPGSSIGIKVRERVRPGDLVFKVTAQ
ncbi:MAG: translation elongation factor-like protein [Candidatus Thermoplasmatota archaeon]